jgi:hypothetical protein
MTDWMAETVTVRDAFVAMINFLDEYYERTGADEIGMLLGGMSLLADDTPLDPAYKSEWLEAVKKAQSRAERQS